MSARAVVFESQQQKSGDFAATNGSSGSVDLRRLKLLSVVLPVAFILGLEGAGYLAVDNVHLTWVHFAAGLVVPSLFVMSFAWLMFRFIGRAQRHVLRQNRELAAVNAVEAGVRGEMAVPQIAEAALQSMLAVTGATEAWLEVSNEFAGTSLDPDGTQCWHSATAPEDAEAQPGAIVEYPLYSSSASIGTIRLRYLADAPQRDRLAIRSMQSIGQQLGCAIQIAHLVDDLQRRKHEGHGFYDVLLRISNQNPLSDILLTIATHVRELLSSDESMICLTQDAFRLAHQGSTAELALPGSAVTGCYTGAGETYHHLHGTDSCCAAKSSPEWSATMAVPIGGSTGTMGELWVARRADRPFGSRDESFLSALSGLAAIAITNARMRENERQAAIVAERERIAREMHDSLAQVLGVTHLQLRALDSHAVVKATPQLSAELTQLADICEEAYRDVREAILGLRESSRADRSLLENLQVYIDKYSHQCGIDASLVSALDHELVLSPKAEVQLIRVIQEALTNVRKHAAAKSVVVRVSQSPTCATFVVEDDGSGFNTDAQRPDRDRFGLYTMRERIRLVNGTLTVESEPGQGTRVIAEIPMLTTTQPGLAEVSSGQS